MHAANSVAASTRSDKVPASRRNVEFLADGATLSAFVQKNVMRAYQMCAQKSERSLLSILKGGGPVVGGSCPCFGCRRYFAHAVGAVAIVGAAIVPAKADLIQVGPVSASGSSFGTSDVILTVHGGNTESASVAPVNGSPVCSGDLSGGCSNPHYSVPTLRSLGWNSASDVLLTFNASEPGGDSINIPADALTLSFYSGNASIFSISNSSALFFPTTNPGTGNIGFTIGVSPSELADVNSAVFSLPNYQDLRLGLSAGLTLAGGGQEAFSAQVGAAPVPGPIVGAGLPGLIAACGVMLALAHRRRLT